MAQIEDMPILRNCTHKFQRFPARHGFIAKQNQRIEISLNDRIRRQNGLQKLQRTFCLNTDRSRITSFATRDGLYRLYGCDVCQRYLKAFDGRNAPRQVMPAVDAIATLPLDAAAVQRGYR